jgi:hypothetical protein
VQARDAPFVALVALKRRWIAGPASVTIDAILTRSLAA